jgi:hypothetical protein
MCTIYVSYLYASEWAGELKYVYIYIIPLSLILLYVYYICVLLHMCPPICLSARQCLAHTTSSCYYMCTIYVSYYACVLLYVPSYYYIYYYICTLLYATSTSLSLILLHVCTICVLLCMCPPTYVCACRRPQFY